jgi:hypothetical protein
MDNAFNNSRMPRVYDSGPHNAVGKASFEQVVLLVEEVSIFPASLS